MIRLSELKSAVGRLGFSKGLKDGLPIALGYIPVAFACGVAATNAKISLGLGHLLSMLLYSGSGQAAAQNLYSGGEVAIIMYALTIFVMNCRYFLFSVAIAQKFDDSMGTLQRIIFGFFNTDETYVVAMRQKQNLGSSYLFGLITFPYIGFTLGNSLGMIFTNIMPDSIRSALSIMIFAMFIALIVPPVKRSKPHAIVSCIAIVLSVVMECVPAIRERLQPGIIIIICAVVSAVAGAVLFPVDEDIEEIEEELAEEIVEGGNIDD